MAVEFQPEHAARFLLNIQVRKVRKACLDPGSSRPKLEQVKLKFPLYLGEHAHFAKLFNDTKWSDDYFIRKLIK